MRAGQLYRPRLFCRRHELIPRVMELLSFDRLTRIALLLLYTSMQCLWAQSPEGFISLDCGANGTYEDPDLQGISWTSDENFVYGGNTATVDPPSTGGGSRQYTSIRYFPGNQSKYCYSLPSLTPQSPYLVRASFWYGKQSIYETKVQNQTSFKLLVDADVWATIYIPVPQENPVVQEIYVRAMDDTISVCLAGKGIGWDTPFISTIELRPLNDLMKGVQTMLFTQRALHKQYRLNLGASSNASVRYPSDPFDRIWDSRTTEPSLSTQVPVGNNPAEQPPVVVLQTAQGGDALRSFIITLPIDSIDHHYFSAMFFAEIDPRVNSSGQRVFTVSVSNQWTDLDIYSRVGLNSGFEQYDAPNSSVLAFGSFDFNFQANPSSLYGPFISGLELLRLSEATQSNGTFAGDVLAILDIMKALNLRSWAGDPCLPYAYEWLNCSQPPFAVRINALFLSNRGLAGTIPPSINNLTELVEISLDQNNLQGDIPNLSALPHLSVLNLSNNSLTGTIPEFLSHMPSLQMLLLENNNLSGPVPQTLLQRSNRSSLYLDFTGNPLLCTTTCPEATSRLKSNHVPLIIGLLAGFLILGCGAAGYALFRARHLGRPNQSPQHNVIRHTELVEMSNTVQAFSYHDIEIATQNFRRKLGEGGFGPVYHGTLRNGVVVAIKVLSDASGQGSREFLNEVAVLSRVHHKNLVRLVGYCIDRKLVLVYEYMSKGTLSESLHGKGIPLDGRTRLSIALDAAQGLEYLHGGCSPRIIHRDVKSSNILLNDRMEGKISDFGISKSNGIDSLTPTAVVGSRGYVDPEYANGMVVTQKIDVYSFGVVLFEIICGHPPIYQTLPNEREHIVDLARRLLQQGNIEEMVDKRIVNEYSTSTLWRIFELAMMCVDSNGNMRPTMTEVCIELREAIEMDLQNDKIDNEGASGQLQHKSIDLTITRVEAR